MLADVDDEDEDEDADEDEDNEATRALSGVHDDRLAQVSSGLLGSGKAEDDARGQVA